MQPTRRTLALLSLATLAPAVGIGLLAACSPPPSEYFATSPGHLRSDVPADTVVTIDFADDFHPSLPAFAGAFPLMGPDGEVAAHTTVDNDGLMTIEPNEPLPPGVYEVYGIFLPRAEGHQQNTFSGVTHVGSVTFTVGSQPRLLGYDASANDLTLVFSEPVQAETVQLEVTDGTLVGEAGAEPYLVRFADTPTERIEPEMLHGQLLAASGEPIGIEESVEPLSPCTMTRIGGGSCSE